MINLAPSGLVSYDQFFQISRGLLSGLSAFGTAGVNPDVDISSVPEDVWGGGGLFPYQAAAVQLEVVSSSTDDAAAGTGARSVLVLGLSSTWAQISEIVVTNGTTPVTTVNSYLRINAFRVASVGAHASGTNVGNITLRVAGAGATQAFMGAGDGQCFRTIFTVPLGQTAFLLDAFVAIVRAGTNEAIEFSFFARTNLGPWIKRNIFSVSAGGLSTQHIMPRIFGQLPEKTDIRFTVTDVSADNTKAQATFIAILQRNP